MNNSMFGLGMYGASSFVDTFFGNSSSSGSSLFSSLGDLQMIQSGVYKKAMKSYVAAKKSAMSETSGTATAAKADFTSKFAATDSRESLSNLKSSSQKLYAASKELKSAKYTGDAKPEDLLGKAKNFVSAYNNTLNAAKDMDSYSILQTAVWSTEQMNYSEGLLNKVGISIAADNTLSIDEEKFKAANMSDLKTLFSGSSSLADRVSQKASTLFNQSANQLAANQGNMTYTMYGRLI